MRAWSMRVLAWLLIISVLILPLCACNGTARSGMTVEVLDVGQSDCTLIRRGETTVMIDCGSDSARAAVQQALRERGIDKIDLLVLTHWHEDHIGNARMLLEHYEVERLLTSRVTSGTLDEELILQAAKECGTEVTPAEQGEEIALGKIGITVLSAPDEVEDINDSSLMLRVEYGDTAFLFTGDAERVGEELLLEMGLDLNVDFLKAGHHGSDTSCCAALLEAASPRHVAISCGIDNDYGFPHAALLSRIEEIGAEVHRTDTEGTLCYHSDGERVAFEQEK